MGDSLEALMPLALFTSYSSVFGGAERILLDIAPALGQEIALAAPEGPLVDEARNAGLRVFPLRQRALRLRAGVGGRSRAAAELAGYAHEQRRLTENLAPDLLIAWGMRSALGCLPAQRTGVPLVFQHNDMLPGPLVGRAVRGAARRAGLVLALSHAIAEDLDPRGTLGERLKVVHPGVDLARFEARTSPVRPPEVVVLGAIVPWKRPDFALDVLQLVRRRHPEVELSLRIVGAPLEQEGAELLGRLLERASREGLDGAVEFPGQVPDSRVELERASCLLHCAPREPFGMAVLEALACARPVIIPDAGGPAEIADRTCAILYPPGAVNAAADAIVELIKDPTRASNMGAKGRELAKRRFELGRARTEFARAVAPLINRRSPTPEGARDCAILTVTRNSADVLGRFLDSVRRHFDGARMVVVDCDSSDETVAIAESMPDSVTIQAGSNIGFGAACNLGMREISEPVTILLNPDTELIDDSLLALVGEVVRVERERLLAPLVLNRDGSRQDTVHPAPCSVPDLVRSLVPPSAPPRAAAQILAPWLASRPKRVGWAVGCALAGRTETLRRLGPFDSGIFLYGEDLDLGLRAQRAGVETWFWPFARVIHHRAHSTEIEFGGEPFELLARARHQVVRRRLGRDRALVDDAAQALTFTSRAMLKRALGREALRERRQLQALAAAARSR
jgi:N-acetylglucosaminyl-diphospho-decaprenol L-rhamnosyltransferase